MQVALWKWNDDGILVERFVNRAVQLVPHAAAVNGPRDPGEQFEVETGVSEGTKSYARRRRAKYVLVVGCDLLEGSDYMIDVTAVLDTNGYANSVLF